MGAKQNAVTEENTHHTNPVLQLDKVTVGYRSQNRVTKIISSLSLTLYPGDCIAILGSNGAGKSTLLKTIAKFIPLLEGTIQLHSTSMDTLSPREISRKLSIVLTERQFLRQMSVYELVSSGRLPYTNWMDGKNGDDYRLIKFALKAAGIQHLAPKKCEEISDGQLQNVLIARALAQDTSLMILDEPSIHLDFYQKIKLFSLLRSLAANQQKAIFFSTHDIELALHYCSKALVLLPDTYYFDTISNLAKQNVFNTLFDDSSVQFDKHHMRFRYS